MTDAAKEVLLEEDEVDLSEVAGSTKSTGRKKRTSAVPADYDPSPDYDAPPDGYHRPATLCWVPRAIAEPVGIENLHHLWAAPADNMEEAQRKHRFLASKIVSVAGEFWVKDRATGTWHLRKRGHEIYSVIMHDWGRDKTRYNIRKATIEEFLGTREFVVLNGTAYVPGAGDFVRVRGQLLLNTYREPPRSYREGAVDTEPFRKLMELIVLNLVGRDVGTVEEWIEEITGPDATDMKWLFHWLASQYQRPGRALPTATWFVGRAQGVGKGLLASVMAELLGRSNVKVVSPEEFKGDWTDFLVDAAFIVLDEIDFGSRKETYDKIKRLIGNDMTAARKRNHGDIIVPSVCNFMFTTNNTAPVALDAGDRRNTFFSTKNTPEAKVRAREFFELSPGEKQQAIEGLAELLALIEIDDVLIGHAFDTDIKQRMIENSISPVEEWLLDPETQAAWPTNHFAPSEWLYRRYAEWMLTNDGFDGCINKKYFFRQLGEIQDLGMVSPPDRKTLQGDKKYRGYIRYDPSNPKGNLCVAEAPFVPAYQASENVIEMRSKLRSRSRRG
jgi:hypothetical protein